MLGVIWWHYEGFEHLSTHAYGTQFPSWTQIDATTAHSKFNFVFIE